MQLYALEADRYVAITATFLTQHLEPVQQAETCCTFSRCEGLGSTPLLLIAQVGNINTYNLDSVSGKLSIILYQLRTIFMTVQTSTHKVICKQYDTTH